MQAAIAGAADAVDNSNGAQANDGQAAVASAVPYVIVLCIRHSVSFVALFLPDHMETSKCVC